MTGRLRTSRTPPRQCRLRGTRARARARKLFEISYRELIEELRYNLRDREDEPVPVFPFSYDWRQPLEAAAQQLASFIDEIIQRTS